MNAEFDDNFIKQKMCQICGDISDSNHFGVSSCRACAAFFRRTVAKRLRYICSFDDNCEFSKICRAVCKSCRLKKCLRVGMDSNSVLSSSPSHHKTIKRKNDHLLLGIGFEDSTELLNKSCVLEKIEGIQIQEGMDGRQLPKILMFNFTDDLSLFDHYMNSMGPIERAFKRLWDWNEPLPAAFLNKHNGIRALLEDGDNLLGKADQFKMTNKCWNKAEYLIELNLLGLMCPTTVHKITKDWMLCVELVKTMPHFVALQMDDQVTLLRHIFAPLSLFIFAYYSHAIRAKTFTRANGLTPISSMEIEKFTADTTIRSIAGKVFCKFVERMNESGIGHEEFLLLIAIFVSNSTVDNLTPSGREYLYNASVHYANVLQKFLQTKFGPLEGMQRFTNAMGLMEMAFRAKQMFEQFMLYYEVFYEKRDLAMLLPNSLKFCLTHQ